MEDNERLMLQIQKLKASDYFFLYTNNHVKNEKEYIARHANVETVLSRVASGIILRVEEKFVQLCSPFHRSTHRGPTFLEFQTSSSSPAVLQQLNFPDCPCKHWSKGSRSEMADAMAGVITAKLKKDIGEERFFCRLLCQTLHGYFTVSPKRYLEFTRLAKIVETEGLNFFEKRNHPMDFCARAFEAHRALIVKMHEDAAKEINPMPIPI